MSHVQTVTNDYGFVSGGTSTAITSTTGNTMCVAAIASGQTVGTPTDSKGNTWTAYSGNPVALSGSTNGYVWYCLNITGGSGHTVTFTPGASTQVGSAVSEFTGRSTSAIDTSGSTTPTGNTQTGPTVTAAANADIWAVDMLTFRGAAVTWTAGGGLTIPTGGNVSGSVSMPVCVGYTNNVSAGSVTPSFTNNSANSGAFIVLSLAQATGAVTLALGGQQAQFNTGILVSSGGALIPYRGFQPRPGPGIGPESDLMFLARRLSSNLVPNLNLALLGSQALFSTGALTPNVAGSLTLSLIGTQSAFNAGSLTVAGQVFPMLQKVVLMPPQVTSGVPTTLTAIGGYSVSSTAAGGLVLGLSLSNRSNAPIFVNLTLYNGTDYFIANGATIPVGESLTMTKSMPIQLTTGWQIRASATGLFDAVMSVAEFSYQ